MIKLVVLFELAICVRMAVGVRMRSAVGDCWLLAFSHIVLLDVEVDEQDENENDVGGCVVAPKDRKVARDEEELRAVQDHEQELNLFFRLNKIIIACLKKS
jgi:hypothetical protein